MTHTYILHNIDTLELGINDFLEMPDTRLTRQSATPYLPLPLSRSKRYSDSCAYKAPKTWLDLNNSARSEPDQNRFKLLLKQKSLSELGDISSVF